MAQYGGSVRDEGEHCVIAVLATCRQRALSGGCGVTRVPVSGVQVRGDGQGGKGRVREGV